jgi:hypothetical protein
VEKIKKKGKKRKMRMKKLRLTTRMNEHAV